MPVHEVEPVTKPLREVRARIERKLAEVAEEVGRLPATPVPARPGRMHRLVAELDACLRPHLQWEERTVHPLVDKYACEGPAAFSASMRYEHQIIYRWLLELEDLADGEAGAFTRRADNLLGTVLAHFELEEHVLFPILDRNVSRTSFRAPAVEAQRG